jgi:hypothetical protein
MENPRKPLTETGSPEKALKEILMDLAKRNPAETLAEQIQREQAEIGRTWALSQARRAAISLSEKMPKDRPARRALRRAAGIWHRKMAKRTIRQSNLADPFQVARLIAQWGRPLETCVRLTDEIDAALGPALSEAQVETLSETPPDECPIDRAREAASRLEAFADGEIPDGIAEIGDVLIGNLDLENPVVATGGPDTTLSFLTNDRLTDHATA